MARAKSDAIVFSPWLNNNGSQDETKADRNAPMDVAYQTKDFLIAQKATLNVLEMYLSIDACDY